MKNGLGGIFFEKNSPQNLYLGIFSGKTFLEILENFQEFQEIFSRKILEKRFSLQNSSKTHFSRIFLEKFFLKFLKIFKNFKKIFSRKNPQVEICGRFFFRKKCPPDHFSRKSSSRTPPPRPFSRNILLQTHPLPRPFFKKNLLQTPPPLPALSPQPLTLLNLKGVRDPTNKRRKARHPRDRKDGRDGREAMKGRKGDVMVQGSEC